MKCRQYEVCIVHQIRQQMKESSSGYRPTRELSSIHDECK